MNPLSEQEEFEFRARAEKENQKPFNVMDFATKTATDPILGLVGQDSASKKYNEEYGQQREALLDTPFMSNMRSNVPDKRVPVGLIGSPLNALTSLMSQKEMAKQAQGMAFDTVTGLGTDYAMAKGPAAIGKHILEPLAKGTENTAGRFLNFYIKPNAAGFKFGANPGRAVAKHIGPQMSRESLLASVGSKKEELLDKLAQGVKDSTGIVDATPLFQHTSDTIKQMREMPRTYSSAIESHQGLFDDLADMIRNKAIVKEGKIYLKPEDAVAVKRAIGEIPSWNAMDPKLGSLSKTSRKIYGSFDKNIDAAVPQHAELNQDISDLIGAEKGIERGTQREQNKHSVSLIDLGIGGLVGAHSGPEGILAGTAASKFMRSAPFNTTAGYVAGKAAKVGKAAGKALGKTERQSALEEIFRVLKNEKSLAVKPT